MSFKTLTIKKEVYDELLKLKREGESFSDLLLRLARRAKNIDVLYKFGGAVDWGDKNKLIKEIYSRRFEKR
jgi:predicted CopG family antitoxin